MDFRSDAYAFFLLVSCCFFFFFGPASTFFSFLFFSLSLRCNDTSIYLHIIFNRIGARTGKKKMKINENKHPCGQEKTKKKDYREAFSFCARVLDCFFFSFISSFLYPIRFRTATLVAKSSPFTGRKRNKYYRFLKNVYHYS